MNLPARGDVLRRKRDGVLYEVVHVGSAGGPDRVQVRKYGAKNLKSTNWLSAEALTERYTPADAPPSMAVAEAVRDLCRVPDADALSASVKFEYGWSGGPESWAGHALEFVRRHPQAKWRWMHVPNNGDWWSLTLTAKIDGANVEVHGPGGWTRAQARRMTSELKDAQGDREGSRTPAAYAYEGALGG